jgi:hypothetical protein
LRNFCAQLAGGGSLCGIDVHGGVLALGFALINKVRTLPARKIQKKYPVAICLRQIFSEVGRGRIVFGLGGCAGAGSLAGGGARNANTRTT